MSVVSKKYHPMQRHLTRLAAVQALYQQEITHESIKHIISQYRQHDLVHWSDLLNNVKLDWPFFDLLVAGVADNQEKIDQLLRNNLEKEWPIDRLETVLRVILRAATFEFSNFSDIPIKVIITEYVNITGCFYESKEIGFINKILDLISSQIRPTSPHDQPEKTTL